MGDAVSGVRLKLDDAFAARQVAREVAPQLPPEAYVTDWTRSFVNFFHAVEITKRLMFVILVVIVLVAAINVVSTLVVMVTGKQGDIAILRTMGASRGSVMRVFIVHGMVLGLAGTLAGVVAGALIALNIHVIVPAVERAFSIKFLAKDVYLIDALPASLRAADVLAVAGVALALCLLATLYPSWRAARTAPADALRYE
jgi:lipoprotein-releasing system permease protein